MESKIEKKLKAFLPYIIIIGVVFLLLPALLLLRIPFITYLVLIGILPLTAGCCCAHYAINKESDFWLCLVAPIFFIPSIFLYHMDAGAIIYLVSYLVCGFLGLTIGDIIANNKGKAKKGAGKADEDADNTPRKAERRTPARKHESRAVDRDTPIRRSRASAARPERVDLDVTDDFFTEDPDKDDSLDTSTTSSDIDAILSEIQNRRND